jgi:tape measure domain-containing protein
VSVVANVAINLDARGVTERLKAIRQTSIGAADGFTKLSARAQAVKSIVEAQQGSFAKASTVQGVFAAKVKNTEFAIKAQIAALRDVQSKVQLNGALYQKAAAQIAQYEATLVKTTATQDRSQKSLGGLRGALVSIGAGALVAGMVRGAAAAEQLQLRLKLLSREYGETERVQQFVAQSAKTFGQSQVEAAAGVADVYARLRPLGTSLAEIETVYKGFNAVALASGTSAEAASGAFLQLSQALGSGRLQGDEFRSIAEQVPGILKLVANEMGVTVSQLKQLGSEGKITSDVLINALAKGFEENKGKISELLALSPAQRFKEFKDSTQALSNTMGSELLPAIVPVVKVATELLRVFGQLPGPMKTIIAAAIGLTAAFVALAPAISTVIGLLTAAQLAALVAAGPWIALAAGITAAAVALASYRTESEKIGAKAAAGDPAAMSAARGRMVTLEQEIALMKLEGAEKASPRSALGGSFANAKAEFARLKRDVTTGQTAAATPTPTPTPTPTTGTGTGTGTGKGKGKDDAARIAEQMQQQLKAADDINFALKNRLAIAQTTEPVAKRMLEYDVKQNEIAKEYDELKKVAKSADELALINANLVIEQRIAQVEYEREINELLIERATLVANLVKASSMPTVYNELEEQDAALQAILDKYPAIGSAADAAATLATSGIAAMIDGTKSAEQVFVEFLSSIADALIDTAKQMIAQYIAIGIARMFAGVGAPGGFAPSGPLAAVGNVNTDVSGFFSPSANGNAFGANGIIPFAKGGIVNSPTLFPFAKGIGLMGEAGPEAILPLKRGADGSLGVMASGGGGDVNVVVNVDAKGSSVEGNEQGANQLGRVISAAVQSELIKQQRPGGILAR